MSRFLLRAEDKEWLLRTEDFFDAVKKYKTPKFTKFCDAREIYIFNQCVKSDPFVNSMIWGGYDNAERGVIGFFPEFVEPSASCFPIGAVRISGGMGLSHRDYLGAVLGIGIKREMIGDILVFDDSAICFATDKIADFITFNLKKVASKNVKASIVDFGDFVVPPKKVKEIYGTVSSMRLDCVVGLLINRSRSEVAANIASERVFVNHAVVTSPSFKLCEGDVVSVRSHAKAEIINVGTETKKGRIRLTLAKYV